MKLYHATKIENIESIINNGIIGNLSNKKSVDLQLNINCVYGFDNLSDAENFIVYDNNQSQYAIFEIETGTNKIIADTEYKGGSYAIICDKISAKLLIEGNTLQ